MSDELLDHLDETIQDLDEMGFTDQAEALYALAYESAWNNQSDIVKEIGMAILRIQAHLDSELPQNVMAGMARCMEVVRRTWPEISLD